MAIGWSLLIAFLLVIILYQMVHRGMIKRATMMLQHEAQAQTDQVVALSLRTRLPKELVPRGSTIVADVWGKGVLVFEYELDLVKLSPATRSWLSKDQLAPLLDRTAKEQGILPPAGVKQPFVITDWWTYENRLHIDVANLMNEATKEYVADLKKL